MGNATAPKTIFPTHGGQPLASSDSRTRCRNVIHIICPCLIPSRSSFNLPIAKELSRPSYSVHWYLLVCTFNTLFDNLYIMLANIVAVWLTLGSLAIAGAVPRNAELLPPSKVIAERQAPSGTQVPDGECTNGPRTRNCWSRGFSIATDFDAKAPPAGKTVTVCCIPGCVGVMV